MATTVFAGCSYTYGIGFEKTFNDPFLWVNLLHTNNKYLKETKLINVSRNGRANAGIFQDAVYAILHNDVKYAIVQWTSMPRYNLSLGLELYETRADFLPNLICSEHCLNNVTYPSSYLQNICDRFTALANDHFEICSLVSYVNSLTKLAKLKNVQIFFINGICPWDQEYFLELSDVLPNEYTKYTKELLHIETRDDHEIFQLYNKIHQEYKTLGSIQSTHWLNLYQSMYSLIEDTNNDGIHPGSLSNQKFSQLFSQKIITALEITR